MSLLDRQGFFYTVVLVGALAVCVLFRVRRVDLLAGAFAAASAMLLYNVAIGPAIVHAVNGYWPGLDYQKLPATALVTDARYTLASLELVAETARIMLGSFPAWVYVLGAGGGLVIAFGRRPRHRDSALGSRGGALRTRPWMLPCLLLLLVASSQVLMFALMILRHPPVYEWPDHRLWYYPLPYQAVLLFGMAMLLGKGLIRGGHKQVWAVNLLLVVVVIGNISHWRDYRRAMLRSPWFPTVYYQSGALKHSLRDRRPAPYLNREYGGFYEFCVRRLPAKR